MNQPTSTPGLGQMTRTLVRAVADEAWAAMNHMPSVSDKEAAMRLRQCLHCHLFIKEQGRCSHCGCFMRFKIRMRTQSCPLGKWPRLTAAHGREASRRS